MRWPLVTRRFSGLLFARAGHLWRSGFLPAKWRIYSYHVSGISWEGTRGGGDRSRRCPSKGLLGSTVVDSAFFCNFRGRVTVSICRLVWYDFGYVGFFRVNGCEGHAYTVCPNHFVRGLLQGYGTF